MDFIKIARYSTSKIFFPEKYFVGKTLMLWMFNVMYVKSEYFQCYNYLVRIGSIMYTWWHFYFESGPILQLTGYSESTGYWLHKKKTKSK